MGAYPADWDQRRKTVYQRDGYTCQRCGAGGGPNGNHELHAHHITPISAGGSHQLDNLLTLCRNCHNAVHNHTVAPHWGSLDEIDGTMPAPSDLPSAVRPYFRYAHAYNAVVDEYEKALDFLDELDEMLEVAVTLEEQGKELPESLNDSYVPQHLKFLTSVSVLANRVDEFLGCRKRGFSRELREMCTDFEDALSESVETFEEYSTQRRLVVEALRYTNVKRTSDSEEYEQMIELREEHETLLEDSQSLLLDLQETMLAEINEELADHPRISVRAETEPISSKTDSTGGSSRRNQSSANERYAVANGKAHWDDTTRVRTPWEIAKPFLNVYDNFWGNFLLFSGLFFYIYGFQSTEMFVLAMIVLPVAGLVDLRTQLGEEASSEINLPYYVFCMSFLWFLMLPVHLYWRIRTDG